MDIFVPVNDSGYRNMQLQRKSILPTEGNGNSEGSGAQKEAISKGVGGGGGYLTSLFFSPGLQVRLMSKLSVILLLISVSNQKLLF